MADSGTSGTFHPPISSNMLQYNTHVMMCTTFYLFVSSQGGVSFNDVGKGGWFLHYLFPPIRKGTLHQVRYNCAICCLFFLFFLHELNVPFTRFHVLPHQHFRHFWCMRKLFGIHPFLFWVWFLLFLHISFCAQGPIWL